MEVEKTAPLDTLNLSKGAVFMLHFKAEFVVLITGDKDYMANFTLI